MNNIYNYGMANNYQTNFKGLKLNKNVVKGLSDKAPYITPKLTETRLGLLNDLCASDVFVYGKYRITPDMAKHGPEFMSKENMRVFDMAYDYFESKGYYK